MPSTQTIDELRKRFKPAAAANLYATYLISVQGEGGGSWLVKINNGECEFTPYNSNETAKNESPADCAISVHANDLDLIISGKLSAMTAALSGVLNIQGELGLAMKLVPVFFSGQIF